MPVDQSVYGRVPTFEAMRPIKHDRSKRESFPDPASYYDEALRAGSLLRGRGTRLSDQHVADTDPDRVPHGHDIAYDLDPGDAPGIHNGVEAAVRQHRNKHPFIPVIVEE